MPTPTVLRTDAELNMGAGWPVGEPFEMVTAPDDREATIAQLAPQADVILTCYAPITARVIAVAERLKGIVKYGVGVDSIDLEAAAAKGVPVAHCPDYGTDTVADHAFALMIGVARKLTVIDTAMRSAGWLWPEPAYRGVSLAGKTIGLVGFGRIGKAMARRAAGFGMRLKVYDPYVPEDTHGIGNLTFAPLDEVLTDADFLSMHCVLTPETRHIIGASELARMKPSAIIVNVSRGALIDEAALVDALDRGAVAGAGLDVFPREPLVRTHPLQGRDNVVLTPHLAFYTLEAEQRLEHECHEAVLAILRGKTPANVKNGVSFPQQA